MIQSEPPKPSDDRNARFVELLGQHERQLNAYVLALVPNWADADDIVQQTRMRLWDQFNSYDETKDFGVWARTIARYQVMTHRKKSTRNSQRLTECVLDKLADTAASMDASTDSRQTYLSECIDEIAIDERRLLVRCYGGNETIKTVAESLGHSFNSIRQALFRLRMRLLRCVEGKLTQEERP